MRSAFRPLRSQFVFPTVRWAIGAANRARDDFRIVHFSVQMDHVHLLVEAADKLALSSGMRGLAVRIARAVNALVVRRGRVWADRWHGRSLQSPRATRNALRYVLGNFRKHHPRMRASIDAFSSAPYFKGFREYRGRMAIEVDGALVPRSVGPPDPGTVRAPRTWLLSAGWRARGGFLSVDEAPSSQSAKTGRSGTRSG